MVKSPLCLLPELQLPLEFLPIAGRRRLFLGGLFFFVFFWGRVFLAFQSGIRLIVSRGRRVGDGRGLYPWYDGGGLIFRGLGLIRGGGALRRRGSFRAFLVRGWDGWLGRPGSPPPYSPFVSLVRPGIGVPLT